MIEIGETMAAVVLRMRQQGRSLEEICQKTGMPRAFVEGVIIP